MSHFFSHISWFQSLLLKKILIMLWTFVPDSTHRYLLLVCINSLSSWDITCIKLDLQMSVAPKNPQSLSVLFPIDSPAFFYSSRALIIPFLMVPVLTRILPRVIWGQTPSSEGSASVCGISQYAVNMGVHSGLVSKWDVWFELITCQGWLGGARQFTHS